MKNCYASGAEQRLSRDESYASDVFFGNAAVKPVRTPTGFLFTDILYKPLKLFFMSLLWRLGTTSIRELKGGRRWDRIKSAFGR